MRIMISEDTKIIYVNVLARELSRLQSELPHVRYMANQSKIISEYYMKRELSLNAQIDQVKKSGAWFQRVIMTKRHRLSL